MDANGTLTSILPLSREALDRHRLRETVGTCKSSLRAHKPARQNHRRVERSNDRSCVTPQELGWNRNPCVPLEDGLDELRPLRTRHPPIPRRGERKQIGIGRQELKLEALLVGGDPLSNGFGQRADRWPLRGATRSQRDRMRPIRVVQGAAHVEPSGLVLPERTLQRENEPHVGRRSVAVAPTHAIG